MRAVFSNIATALLTTCAVLITVLVLRREFFLPSRGGPTVERLADGWQSVTLAGRLIGPADAPLRVVVFSDFQCPFCAQARIDLESLQAKSSPRVAIVFRHFPIANIHPYAIPAANAAECAGAQGRFKAYHDALFAAQASIGTQSWEEFARVAGVSDEAEFGRCVAEQRFNAMVIRDLNMAKGIGVKGTPTFMFGGRLISGQGAVELVGESVHRALQDLGQTNAAPASHGGT